MSHVCADVGRADGCCAPALHNAWLAAFILPFLFAANAYAASFSQSASYRSSIQFSAHNRAHSAGSVHRDSSCSARQPPGDPVANQPAGDPGASCPPLLANASVASTPTKVNGVKVVSHDRALVVNWDAQAGRAYNVQWKSGNQGWTADRSQDGITTTTHTISSLTNNTEYSVRVRARDSFNTSVYGPWSDIVKATPPSASLAHSNVTATSVTLTLSNYGGTWYYKHSKPTAGTCTSAGNATSVTVSDLLAFLTYQFQAYSDSSCSMELATTGTFRMRAGKTTGVSATERYQSLAITWTPLTVFATYIVQWKSGAQDWSTTRQVVKINTSSHTITNLTNNTQYTIRVGPGDLNGLFSTGEWSDTVTGTPVDATLTASSVEATTATLTIGNYGAAWYHKYTTPTGGSCSSVVAAGTATADLTGLAGNTSYTYKAYSDSGCTTELATAAAFLTKPAKPTGFTVTRSGSGELTLKATVSGAGTIDKWQFQQKSGGSFGGWNDVTSATTVSLTNGTAYTFKVRACNGNQVTCNGVATLAAVVDSVQSTTAWYYKYTVPTGGACSSVVSSDTTTASLTGLTPFTSYTFKAYSDSGCATELTNDTSDAEFTTKIGKVTGLKVAPRHQSLAVSWNAVEGHTFYWIRWKSGNEDWSQNFGQRSTLLTGNSTSYTIPSLTNDIEHSVRVSAIRGEDYGPYSDVVTATPAIQVPDKPSAPTLTNGSNDGDLNISWTAPGNGGATITGYGVQYRKASVDTWSTLTHSGTGTTAALTGLTVGTSYQVRVRATNSVGSSAWSNAAARDAPGGSGAPLKSSTPVATAGNASVMLTWRSGGSGGSAITSWEYSQAVKPSGGTFGTFGSWTTTSTTIASLTNGSAYEFKVRAVNSNGNGTASDASNAAIPAVAPLSASNVTASGATLTLGIRTAAWAYKQTAPTPAGTCTAVAGLASNTSHNFKAYSDSNCSKELSVAPTFLTKPGKPAMPSAAGAGSGTLTGWEYVKKTGGGDFESEWTDISSTATSLSHTVSGLTEGVNY